MTLKFGSIAAALLLSATFVLTGCAAEPAKSVDVTTPPSSEPTEAQSEAVWLDEGRFIGLVTWGSSSCVPFVGEVAASGQDITVELSDTIEGQEARPCTADFAPRASVIGVPEGVDPSKDTTIKVNYFEQQLTVSLKGAAGLTGTPGQPTDYLPSAAWMTDGTGIVLLTWGSSTCQPLVSSIDLVDGEIVASFAPQEGMCTMDLVPRTTILGVPGNHDATQLKLVGDNLDATVQITV